MSIGSSPEPEKIIKKKNDNIKKSENNSKKKNNTSDSYLNKGNSIFTHWQQLCQVESSLQLLAEATCSSEKNWQTETEKKKKVGVAGS